MLGPVGEASFIRHRARHHEHDARFFETLLGVETVFSGSVIGINCNNKSAVGP